MSGFKKNSPGCNCCESGACRFCIDAPPDTIPLTWSGWSAGTNCANCSGLNAQFIHTRGDDAAGWGCRWEWQGTILCGGTTLYVTSYLEANQTDSPFYTQWTERIEISTIGYAFPQQYAVYKYTTYSSAPFDCEAQHTANRTAQTNGGLICTAPTTCLIN